MLVSFVIPCYKSANTVGNVVEDIQKLRQEQPFDIEIVLVNDGSGRDTFDAIERLVAQYDNITGVDLAKNRGQQSAIMAGFKHTKGEIIVVSDDDGQTPVEAVPTMIRMLDEDDLDVVCARYVERGKRSLFRRFGSWVNDMMVKYFLEKPDDIDTSVFFTARRFVAEEMMRYQNPYPYMAGLLLRTTYRIGNLELEQKARLAGQSGYTFSRLFSLWLNGITTFSVKPLRFANYAGILFALIGFIVIIVLVIEKFIVPDVSLGWTSLIATNLLVGGVILIVLGMIGEYIGRIYLCLNKTPQYVERTVIGRNAADALAYANPGHEGRIAGAAADRIAAPQDGGAEAFGNEMAGTVETGAAAAAAAAPEEDLK